MIYYLTLAKFHIYNKIHQIHRNNINKSWKRVQGQRRKLRVLMDRKGYIELLKKNNINNLS